jgi:hypothetical protein
MKKINDFNSAKLTADELNCLKGGMRYFIGKDEVSKETYKAHVECMTGSPSKN